MRLTPAAILATVVSTTAVAQGMLGLMPHQNASMLRGYAGEIFTFVCPAIKGVEGKVLGTDVYTEDSAICFAAIHAGALKPGEPGAVNVLVGYGVKHFESSERNGIKSGEYGAWPHSYRFLREGEPGLIGWSTVWNGIPMDFKEPVALRCPPGGHLKGTIWGTDVYTRDSAICIAAVHVGALTLESGGHFLVRRAPGPKEFEASERYGVASKRWGPLEDAFAIESAIGSPPPPPPAEPPPDKPPPQPPHVNPPSRMIVLAGYSGTGTASIAGPIPHRTLALGGFTGVGTASQSGPIPPRTLQVKGWTGVGSAP